MREFPSVERPGRGAAWVAGSLLLACIAAWLAYGIAGHIPYSPWTDRDLERAAALMDEPQSLGAEVANASGARVFGGALYHAWWVILQVDQDPRAVFLTQALLLLAGAGCIGWAVGRRAGPGGGLVAALLVMSHAVVLRGLEQAWNPGFLPIFAGLAILAGERAIRLSSIRSWVLAGIAIGIGGQFHYGALFLLLLPAGLMAVRPKSALAGFAAVILGLCLTHLPFAADYFRGGGLEMVAFAADTAGTPGWVPRNVATYLAWVMGAVELDWHGLLFAAIILVLAIRAVHSVRRDALLLGLLAVAVLPAGYFLLSRHDDLAALDRVRYVLVPALALCAICGLGVAEWDRALPRRRAVALAALVVAVLPPVMQLARQDEHGHHLTLTAIQAIEDEVEGRLGWDLSELARRLVVARPIAQSDPCPATPSGWDWRSDHPITYPLRQRGAEPAPEPGSGRCAVLFLAGSEGRPAACGVASGGDSLQHLFRGDVDATEVSVAATSLGPLVTYNRPEGYCPNGFGNRYLATAEEVAANGAAVSPATAPVARITDGVAIASVGLLPMDTPAFVADRVNLLAEILGPSENATLRLHSNQLRGRAQNRGALGNAMIRDLGVTVMGPDGQPAGSASLRGWIGFKGMKTPVSLPGLPLADGSVLVLRFVAATGFHFDEWPPRQIVEVPVALTLGRVCSDVQGARFC